MAISSCTKKVDVGDFDTEAWKADSNGCTGVRANMTKAIMKLKPKLLELYQKSVIEVLGQPEEQELYERSQTYYLYYIDPAGDCENSQENPRKLMVRFTALGIANEVNIR
ncbi:MAG: hypothetical protein HEP71_20160 [Roseivirga sp.]|nr:hypothetical protein [Roseivirga sp.]